MTKAQLVGDAEYMIMNGPEPAEQVIYQPWQGTARTIVALVTRTQVEAEFSGGVAIPTIDYTVFLVNDSVKGAASIQNGRDQISMKLNIADIANSLFRVVSHTSDQGMHQLQVKL